MTSLNKSPLRFTALVILGTVGTCFVEDTYASVETSGVPVDAKSVMSRDAQIDELIAQVRALQVEVAQLRAAGEEPWLTERRAQEITALVHDVLADAATENLSLIIIGVVKYLKNHQLKWTNDVGVALSEVTAMFANTGASWRTDTPGQDGQVVFRSQFQLVF